MPMDLARRHGDDALHVGQRGWPDIGPHQLLAGTNVGIVLPEPGYHEAVRAMTRKAGSLLIIDETHTICAGPGGMTARDGLEPDMLVIGKTIGGGIPAGTYGMTHAIADRVRAAGDEGGLRLRPAALGGRGRACPSAPAAA